MEIRNPLAIAVLAFALVGGMVTWQFLDNGLGYAKAHLENEPHLVSELGAPLRLFAYRARFTETQRIYWVVVSGERTWTFQRAAVDYEGASPKSARFIGTN